MLGNICDNHWIGQVGPHFGMYGCTILGPALEIASTFLVVTTSEFGLLLWMEAPTRNLVNLLIIPSTMRPEIGLNEC